MARKITNNCKFAIINAKSIAIFLKFGRIL
jgi:hypothetical protein